jgi:hypothetical protein
MLSLILAAADTCLLQPPRRKRGPYKRHKDPAEVSANYRAAANRLVEYGGELITAIERAGRISGETGG